MDKTDTFGTTDVQFGGDPFSMYAPREGGFTIKLYVKCTSFPLENAYLEEGVKVLLFCGRTNWMAFYTGLPVYCIFIIIAYYLVKDNHNYSLSLAS